MTAQTDLLAQILDPTNRADPYPLYAEARRTPVLRTEDGSYLVSTYREVALLARDPRLRKTGEPPGGGAPAFINLDPPEHDRLRRVAVGHFDQSEAIRPVLLRIVTDLIDRLRGRRRIDLVDDFAYPLPVTVICDRLGVPRQDEHLFQPWADAIIASLGLGGEQVEARRARAEMRQYMGGLVDRFRQEPGTGLLSDLATGGAMTTGEIVETGVLLLIAGHETTVNLITNGMLTLLRHPDVLARLRGDPDLAITLVEELLRYEPPVHVDPAFTPLDDIEVAGVTIPRGAPLLLALAAANRDPDRFPEPDRFDPDRQDNAHLSFLGGIHYCFGAPLARQEAQIALIEFARRLENVRLVEDPPPYRPNAFLRGPRHLLVEIDGVTAE